MKDLIIKCLQRDADVTVDEKASFGDTTVFKVETDEDKLTFWNSSNRSAMDKREMLTQIAAEMSAGETGGSLSEPYTMAEIMWEVTEK